MRHVIIFATALSMLFLSTHAARAEETRKVVYMNAAKVFDAYYKTEEADGKLTKKAEAKNKEREKLVNKVNKLKDELEIVAKEARAEKEEKLNNEMRALQDFDRETRTNLQRERNDMMKDILSEIGEAIKDYGAKMGYDYILDDRVLLYAGDELDATDEIIEVLNKGR